jgi:hypothetical protein
MSGNGCGSRDSVQAPLTLITAFLRLARSSTFGRSAHCCGGAGGVRGRRIARWSIQRRACIDVAPAQYVDREVVLYGRVRDAVEARIIRIQLRLLCHPNADTDGARCPLMTQNDRAFVVKTDDVERVLADVDADRGDDRS